jgi:uncharacterized protein (DUF4213/DUF364 family)
VEVLITSKIIDDALALINDQIPNLREIRVSEVRIGLGYTGVKLDAGHVGVCHSLLRELALDCCQTMRRAGSLADSPAIDLANLAKSWGTIESIVGVATLNALSQVVLDEEKYQITEGNFIDYIEKKIRKSDTVTLVGLIEPFVEILRRKTRHMYVFERNPTLLDEQTLPDTACEEFLPQADIVIATGSSIANKTIDHILELSQGAREIGVVGPSAGLIPDPLFERGVTIIGSIKALNADRLLQIIAEGGGTPQMKSAVKFINIRPKP